MAISEAERNSAFEILGLTLGPGAGVNEDTATIHTGFGISLTLSDMDKLRDNTNLYLDSLDADKLIRVQSIIADYDEISDTYGVEIDQGSVGDVNGVSLSFEKSIDRIRQRLMTYVPVMHMVESIRQREGPRKGFGVSFAR